MSSLPRSSKSPKPKKKEEETPSDPGAPSRAQNEITRPPIPSALTFNFGIFFLATCVAGIAYYASVRYSSGLSDVYALCSRDGDKSIYTVNGLNENVECLLVDGSHIVDTGDLATLRAIVSNRSLDNDLTVHYTPAGSIVIPGISDAHCHILEYGASRLIPLSEGKTINETVSFIKQYIVENSDLEKDPSRVIEGWGWDHASWDVADWPSWEDLEADPAVAGHKVILQSRDGHALWVSKRTMLENEPFPEEVPGGVIIRDAAGKPTGVFIDSAQELIKRLPPTDEDLDRLFQVTVKHALAVGLTSLHDAGFKPDSLGFFMRQVEKGQLPLRIYGMTFFNETEKYWGDQVVPFSGKGNERLSSRSVKIFADGALRTGFAALYEPYADNPSTNGVMRISAEVLNAVIPRFLRDGWQVNVHAIGDRANGIVLDAFEEALKGINVTALRPRLEHAQIMTKADMDRVGKLGVIASIQPTHAISDMWFSEDRLGPERVKGLYAFRGLLDSGARIALGSDFPVEEVNPLKGFYAAVSRLAADGTSPHGPGGWFPEQRLTRLEALRGMTIDPAYASFTEDILGSLEPGKRADYVILSQDIMTAPAASILDTKVVATVMDGKVVYGAL